jgi:hypothetical protein
MDLAWRECLKFLSVTPEHEIYGNRGHMKLLLFVFLFVFFSRIFSQSFYLAEAPSDLQLYVRDSSGRCEVPVSGAAYAMNIDSVILEVYGNNNLISRDAQTLAGNSFSFSSTIDAGLVEYRFIINIKRGGRESLAVSADSVVCGDVFMVNGQSNAETQGGDSYTNQWIRSFGSTLWDDARIYELGTWGLANALSDNHAIDVDSSMFYVGVWALRMGKSIVENYGIPVCFINSAKSGTSLELHMRNDSDVTDYTTIYGRLLWRMRVAKLNQQVTTMLWNQGESNSGETNALNYFEDFVKLKNLWQEDYPGLKHIYMFQIRGGCGSDYQDRVQEAQRRLAEAFDEIRIMTTYGLHYFKGCHYMVAGYHQMAEWLFPLVAQDCYGEVYDHPVTPPNILTAGYTDSNRDEIKLQFDQEVVWQEFMDADSGKFTMFDYYIYIDSGPTPYLKDYLFLDGEYGAIANGSDSGSIITLSLTSSSSSGSITYLPTHNYHDYFAIYDGPWIWGRNGITALSFYDFPIDDIFVPAAQIQSDVGPIGSVKIYQSNTGDRLTVEFQNTESGKLYIADINGRSIFSRVFRNAGEKSLEQIDLSAFSSGIYFLKVKSGVISHSEKIAVK